MATSVEGAAKAAYEATVRIIGAEVHEPWETVPPYWQRAYRAQAQAVIDYLNQKPAPPSPSPGQLALFGGDAA